MNELDMFKAKLSAQARLIKNWNDACDMASSEVNTLLARAIYSAMDNVEDVQREQGISATEAFEHFQGSVQSCIDDAEGMYGEYFVKECFEA